MARFAFVYRGGKKPESPEEGEKVMAEWGAWYGAMGSAVQDGGGPAGMSGQQRSASRVLPMTVAPTRFLA